MDRIQPKNHFRLKTAALACWIFLLFGCTDIPRFISVEPVQQPPSIKIAQTNYVYDLIVHNWRKVSTNAVFPQPYSAEVELYFSPDGQLRFSHFNRLSGNSKFDQELERAIQLSSNLGTELSRPLEVTLTFNQTDMVLKKYHRSYR